MQQRQVQFGLRTFLVLIVVISALFASYRFGYEHGRELGPVVPADLDPHALYNREYDVSDIVSSNSDAEMIIQSLRKTVKPDNWAAAGGYAEVSFNSNSNTLAVDHVWLGHLSIVTYLSTFREYATGQNLAADLEEAEWQFAQAEAALNQK